MSKGWYPEKKLLFFWILSKSFGLVLVFSDLFHEGLHDGTTSNAQNHELERSRPVVYVEAKYFCHIKYDGDQFRYIAQREIQL